MFCLRVTLGVGVIMVSDEQRKRADAIRAKAVEDRKNEIASREKPRAGRVFNLGVGDNARPKESGGSEKK